MKKILFNDKYGLTKAVLDGRKTQTRRVANIDGRFFFGDFGIDEAGRAYTDFVNDEGRHKDVYPAYQLGEVVAVAQSYQKVFDTVGTMNVPQLQHIPFNHKGWHNKMFVKPELLPHRIKISNVRVERLQDISDEDCLQEGIESEEVIECHNMEIATAYYCHGLFEPRAHRTPREAYAHLIDKVSGKGTWEENPWVFVYDFELIK